MDIQMCNLLRGQSVRLRLLLFAPLLANTCNAQVVGGGSAQEKVQFVQVEPSIRLEVKDWGGTGRPVVLLAGLGSTLHTFDDFAPKLIDKYHVYGITRRGYGDSSHPDPIDGNYAAERLGDDVLFVMDQMNIQRPVLIGHSFAGEELSSVCSRLPSRIAGLVYLDAAYRYAFSPVHRGDFRIDTLELQRELAASLDAISPAEARDAVGKLQEMLPQFQADLNEQKNLLANAPNMSAADYDEQVKERSTLAGQIEKAALDGERRYTELKCPALAIFALPHDHNLPPGPKRDAADASEMQTWGPLVDSFEAGVPSARVIRIAHAEHAVYKSNEAEVVHEVEDFIGGLKDQ
jgi:pimeloyl-ACP methyl ester carboxylesterase